MMKENEKGYLQSWVRPSVRFDSNRRMWMFYSIDVGDDVVSVWLLFFRAGGGVRIEDETNEREKKAFQ